MLRYVRQVKLSSCQIMIPLPLTFLTHSAIARSRFPCTKSPPPGLESVGSWRAHASRFLHPPPSLLSLRLAPRHSARKNTSLRSAVFSLLRSGSRLHNLLKSNKDQSILCYLLYRYSKKELKYLMYF